MTKYIVDMTPRQLEEIGIDYDEIIGAEVTFIREYSDGYYEVEWESEMGPILYDIPNWFLKKV